MAGIAGIYAIEDGNLPTAPLETTRKMLNAIRHRGPDKQGFHRSTGMCIGWTGKKADCSGTDTQPLRNENEKVWIACDGRIWNKKKLNEMLKKRGHKFYTNIDAENVVHLYEEFDKEFIKKIDGVFALVLYDEAKKRLIMARDRVGVRPLYYTEFRKNILFGSEIKALLQFPNIIREVDPRALTDYLLLAEVLRDKTLFKGIKRVLPSHILLIENSKISKEKYWDFDFRSSNLKNEDYYTEQVKEKIKKAVEKQTNGLRTPYSSYLSGGLDTTAITYMLRFLTEEPINTFSIAFKPAHDESKYVSMANEVILSHHHKKIVNAEDYIESISKAIWYLEEIRKDDSSSAIYFAAQSSSKFSETIFSGMGGDELLCGYVECLNRYAATIVKKLISGRINVRDALDELYRWSGKTRIRKVLTTIFKIIFPSFYQRLEYASYTKKLESLFSKDFLRKLNGYFSPKELNDILSEEKDPFDRYRRYRSRVELPNLLRAEDAFHAAFSVESRVPILDMDVVETVMHIPSSYLVKGMNTKYLLRKILEEEFPKGIVTRPKLGFSIPLHVWFRTELRDFVYGILLSPKTLERGYFNEDYVKKIVNDYMGGNIANYSLIGSLINFELWHRIFIDPSEIKHPFESGN